MVSCYSLRQVYLSLMPIGAHLTPPPLAASVGPTSLGPSVRQSGQYVQPVRCSQLDVQYNLANSDLSLYFDPRMIIELALKTLIFHNCMNMCDFYISFRHITKFPSFLWLLNRLQEKIIESWPPRIFANIPSSRDDLDSEDFFQIEVSIPEPYPYPTPRVWTGC